MRIEEDETVEEYTKHDARVISGFFKSQFVQCYYGGRQAICYYLCFEINANYAKGSWCYRITLRNVNKIVRNGHFLKFKIDWLVMIRELAIQDTREDRGERCEQNVNRFEIHTDLNLPAWERIEPEEDKLEIEQGEKIMATYQDRHVEDIDSLWFLLVFPYCFLNGQGLPAKKVSVKRWLSYLIQIEGNTVQSSAYVCAIGE